MTVIITFCHPGKKTLFYRKISKSVCRFDRNVYFCAQNDIKNMNDPIRPVKKPSGCWFHAGCLLTIVSTLLALFFVYMIFESEEHMDRNRAEYSASEKEYQEALEAYEADSVNLKTQYQRVQAELDAAQTRHDSVAVTALQDSLKRYSEPEFIPRGAIGVNIGGAFFLVFALAMLIPLAIGLLLLLYYRYRKRKWHKDIAVDLNNRFSSFK